MTFPLWISNKKVKHYNDEKILMVQVENPTAIENLDAMLDTKEIAAIIIEPCNLSVSLGIPGDFENALSVKNDKQVIERCHKHQVFCGMYMLTEPIITRWMNEGMNIVWASDDLGLIKEGLKYYSNILKELD